MRICELAALEVSNAQLARITGVGTKRAWAKLRQGRNEGSLSGKLDSDISLTDIQREEIERAILVNREYKQRQLFEKEFSTLISKLITKLRYEQHLCSLINDELSKMDPPMHKIVKLGAEHDSLIKEIGTLQTNLGKCKQFLGWKFPESYMSLLKRTCHVRRETQVDVVALVTRETQGVECVTS